MNTCLFVCLVARQINSIDATHIHAHLAIYSSLTPIQSKSIKYYESENLRKINTCTQEIMRSFRRIWQRSHVGYK